MLTEQIRPYFKFRQGKKYMSSLRTITHFKIDANGQAHEEKSLRRVKKFLALRD